jgi:hypothetical protein
MTRCGMGLVLMLGAGASAAGQPPARAQAQAAETDSVDVGWPRQYTSGGTTFTVYQPQLDEWDGDQLAAHAAVAVKEAGKEEPTYGVIWLDSRTDVDKVNRQVYLNDTRITKSSFPSATSKTEEWHDALQTQLPERSKVLSLDRLEAQLAVEAQRTRSAEQPLKNDPPRILASTVPAMLILIDGQPALRQAGGGLERVINTRPLLLKSGNTYYLHVFDGWMQAADLNRTWAVATSPPASLKKAMEAAVRTGQVDLLTGESGDTMQPKPSLAKGPVPAIYVSTTPAELLVFEGEPNYVPVDGTQLLYAKNTSARVFKSIGDNDTYVLISGRWYRASSLEGPWTYVPGTQLPSDFARLPDASPVENVKASVPGTRQAQEALIANSVLQTAAVKRTTAMRPPPSFDGDPELEPVAGTSLSYVVNSSVPIIEVNPSSFYAVQNGIWFVGSSVEGPWAVAASVPAVIYSIPPSSPLYYVTYVQVYHATPEVVYVGYTPGYYGTVVAPGGVVVYGTGYPYVPWVGTVWYGPPVTYGFGVSLCWTPWTSWAFGFGFGWAWGASVSAAWGGWGWGPRPWWGPAAWGWGWGAAVGPYGGYARWGPGGWYGTTGNIYSRWGNTSVVSRTSGGFNTWTGNGWGSQVGRAYNSTTGTLAAGQRAAVGNVYTGDYAYGRRGVASNTRTGVTAAGRQVNWGNAYNGHQVTTGSGRVYDPRTGNSVRVSGAQGANGGAVRIGNTTVARSGDDVYAGRDGNVYRREGNGNWQQRVGGSWQSTSGEARARLEGQANARSAGGWRAQGFNRIGGFMRGHAGGWRR